MDKVSKGVMVISSFDLAKDFPSSSFHDPYFWKPVQNLMQITAPFIGRLESCHSFDFQDVYRAVGIGDD